MGSLTSPAFSVSKIAVIGAGPCGLAAAKYLKAQGSFSQVTVLEQQDEVGGVWNYNEETPGPSPIPQQDPFLRPDEPLKQDGSKAPIFPSPMYHKLHANIPGQLMRFSDKAFPKDAWAFPSREYIQDYLLEYAKDVRDLVRFCYQVTHIDLSAKGGHDRWRVQATSTIGDGELDETFDAVVISNGHYATPSGPAISNIKEFSERYPGSIIHSKHFRRPDVSRDKKVVVVGNGPSGTDIALQINGVCRQPALLSVKEATPEERLAHTGCREVPQISEFLVEQRGVRFADGSVETDIDAVVFCTGFMYSYPFLDKKLGLITDGKGVHGLYKHLIHIEHPTLVFPGLNIKAIPWPTAEAQASVFAALWANTLSLPSKAEMRQWSQDLEKRKESALHVFSPLEDGHYINGLHDWAAQASFLGKEGPRWDDEKFWERKVYGDAKLRFEKAGGTAKTLDELGLRYEPERTI